MALGSAILGIQVQQLMPESESSRNLSLCHLPSSWHLSRRGERTSGYITGLENVGDVQSDSSLAGTPRLGHHQHYGRNSQQ